MTRKRFSMQSDYTLAKQGVILVSVPLLFELIFVGTLAGLLHQAEAEVRRESHARAVSAAVNDLIKETFNLRRYMLSALYQKRAQTATEHLQQFRVEVDKIAELVKDNSQQAAITARARQELEAGLELLMKVRRLVVSGEITGKTEVASEYKEQFRKLKNATESDLQSLIDAQQRVVEQSPEIQAGFRRQVEGLLVAGIAMNILLAVALALYFSKSTARRLAVLMDNSRRLAGGKPLNPPLTGSDEIAHLDKVFNEMADALAAASRKERAIIENATDMICSLDGVGTVSAVSPACQRVLGYAPEELINTQLMKLIVDEDKEKTVRAIEKLRAASASMSFENRVHKKDGTVVDMLWSAQWSPKENAMFCVAHDMSARKQLERIKQEFMAMVSHDLRTPLCSIQVVHSNLEKGIYGGINEAGQKAVHGAENNVTRLIKLVNDLLETAKVEAGKLDLTFADTTLSSIVEKSVMSVLGFADQHGVSFEVELSDSPLRADQDRLVQVLVNLLSNAVKFSPRGGSVKIATENEPDYVEVQVIDQGPGVPKDMKEAIFDPFRQVRKTDATEKGGTGLGLSICRSIIEEHGGTIGVESEDGKGSTFWFRLPKVAGGAQSAS